MKTNERQKIYKSKCNEYEQLVAREDYNNNILKAILNIKKLKDSIIVDSGAGTGRLSRIIEPFARHIYLFDIFEEMLDNAKLNFSKSQLSKMIFSVADHRNLNLSDNSIDIVMSGWSICHLIKWNKKIWKEELKKTILEFERVINQYGTIIIFETLGTGVKEPNPPTIILEKYYNSLESDYKFLKKIIKTDYLFNDQHEFENLIGFFFGKEKVNKIIEEKIYEEINGKILIPEFTGVWYKQNK